MKNYIYIEEAAGESKAILIPLSRMSSVQALNVFMNTPVNNQMLHALVNSTLKVLPQSGYQQKCDNLPLLFTFITRLVKYTNVFTGTLMATLVYLKRLHERLPPGSSAQAPTSRHRIFLACLILSAKFHNDASPKNKHWAKYTDGLFTTHEVNEMERQLLLLLDWDVSVLVQELSFVLRDFLTPIKTEIKNVIKLKTFLTHQQQSCGYSSSAPSSAPSTSPYSIVPCLESSNVVRSLSTNSVLKPSNASQIKKFPSLPQLSSSKSAPRINYNSIQYLRSLNSSSSLASYETSLLQYSLPSVSSSLSSLSSETFSPESALSTPPEEYYYRKGYLLLKKSQKISNLYLVY